MKALIGFLSRAERVLGTVRTRLVLMSNNVRAGSGLKLESTVRLRATDGGFLSLGQNVSIDRFADVTVKFGKLQIGSNTYVGQGTVICSRESILIGSNAQIAEHVTIRDQDHIFGLGLITPHAGFITEPVVIGDNVWIGAKSTITKGVCIGKNSVVGANSVVTRDVPEDAVVGGVPARLIRKIGETSFPSAVDSPNLFGAPT